MKTPKIYTENINTGIITNEMLRDCLFSVNKRAKNCRDNERRYRHYRYDKYDTEERYREKKEDYYKQKEKLLSIVSPVCIHREFGGYPRIRVYDYEPEFQKYADRFFYTNSYFDRDYQDVVTFGDYEDTDNPNYRYYLFYEVGNKSFHTPIDEWNVKKYDGLIVKDINQLDTYGHDISDLISVQFVKKVIALIDAGTYQLVSESE